MPEVMMSLGGYHFAVDTAAYQSLRRFDSYRWPTQDRLAQTPASHYTGRGAPQINLRGVIYPHYKGGLDQISTLRGEAERGEPMLLVTGRGEVLDRWVITFIGEEQSVFFSDGTPKKMEFRLTLQQYGEEIE